MSFKLPKLVWPIEKGKELGLYCYFKEILEQKGCKVKVQGDGEMIMLASYSYLGLLHHPEIEQAAIEAIKQYSTGSRGSRLLSGTNTLHIKLENKLAEFYQTEASIVFSSGYLANITTISTLVGRHDYVICDKINHASIFDGCLLSGAKLFRFKHNDMQDLEQLLLKITKTKANVLVVVDGVFSMDGDIANLPEISKLCKKYGAFLMVDEAHSLGVIGETGKGIEEHFDLPSNTIDVKMGVLSKTIPSAGGFVAGSKKLIDLLKHNGRGFVYTGALVPAETGAALKGLEVVQKEQWRIKKLKQNAQYFTTELNKRGFNTFNSKTLIIPILCGDDMKGYNMAKRCWDEGLFVHAIPSPVVPQGTTRIRCIITTDHDISDLDYCIDVIERAGKTEGVI